MKTTKEQLDKSRVKLTIDLEQKEVRPFLEAAAKELSEKHPVKGFRPGTVPLKVMRSAVGDERIIETALQKLVPKTYVDAILEDETLEAIGQPEISAKKVGIDEDWQYEAIVATLPEISLGSYKEVAEKRVKQEISDEEVSTELEELRKMRASYITVPRAAQKGDKIELDVQIFSGNVPLEQGSSRKQTIVLGDGQLLPDFESQITGTKEGDAKKFPITFPADHIQKDLQGKTVDFSIKILNIQQQILPELNDSFAQGLGKFSTLEELKGKLKENMLQEKEQKEKERIQQSLLNQVIKKTTFGEIPEILIKGETDKMVSELERGMTSMGLTMEQYLQQLKKTPEQLREGLNGQAIERIKAGLTLRAIGKKENIRVEDAEVEKEINQVLKHFPDTENAKKKIDLDALADVTLSSIKNRKVFDLLEKAAGIQS